MRQEQHDAAEAVPLVFGADDELIDDHLGGVDEVAELRLPEDEAVGAIEAVAVFEAQHAGSRRAGCCRFRPAPDRRRDAASGM